MIPTLADFAGAWSFDRTIQDRRAGHTASVGGTAVFEPNAAGLRYVETGTLHLPNAAPLEARQVHFWRAAEDGIEVCFSDGRAFHRIDPATDAPRACHDCAPDLYRVAYDFSGWPRWDCVWEVTGPRKNYRMTTQYRTSTPLTRSPLPSPTPS